MIYFHHRHTLPHVHAWWKTHRQGKIRHATRGIIQVILLKTLQCLWSQSCKCDDLLFLIQLCANMQICRTKVLVLFLVVPTVRLATTFDILYLKRFQFVSQCAQCLHYITQLFYNIILLEYHLTKMLTGREHHVWREHHDNEIPIHDPVQREMYRGICKCPPLLQCPMLNDNDNQEVKNHHAFSQTTRGEDDQKQYLFTR